MTDNYFRNKEIAMQRRNKQDEIDARHKDTAVSTAGNIASSAIGALGRLGGKVIGGKTNSPEWYKNYPGLQDILGKLPGLYYAGLHSDDHAFIPDICVLWYADTFGMVTDDSRITIPASDLAINQSAKLLQADLRSFNSRVGQYNPSDLFQVTYAKTDLIRLVVRAMLALKCYKTFKLSHPNYNVKLLEALGFTASDMEENYESWVSFIQTEIAELNDKLFMPDSFTLLARKLFLDSNIWSDDDGKNNQTYLFRCTSYRQYDEANARLVAYQHFSLWTFSSWKQFYRNCKDRLFNSSFVITLNAEIEAASKQGLTLFKFPVLTLDPVVVAPIDEVLDQIQNATIIPEVRFISGPNYFFNQGAYVNNAMTAIFQYLQEIILKQDAQGNLIPTMAAGATSAEIYTPYAASGGTVSTAHNSPLDIGPEVMNFLHDNPSEDDWLTATRFTVSYILDQYTTVVSGSYVPHKDIKVIYHGSEVLLGMQLLQGTYFNSNKLVETTSGVFIRNIDFNLSTQHIIADNTILPLLAYKCNPVNQVLTTVESSGAIALFKNVTLKAWHSAIPVGIKNIYQFHLQCNKSLFHLGMTAKVKVSSSTKSGRRTKKIRRSKKGNGTAKGTDTKEVTTE